MDDDINAVNVDAAGRDVRRHEHTGVVAGERCEGAFALRLAHAAVQSARFQALQPELLDQPLGAALGANEEDRAARTGGNVGGHANLLLFRDGDEAVQHRRQFVFRRDCGVVDGVVLVALHERVNGAVQRGQEEQRLVLLLDAAEDALNLRQEAKVGHLVRFVDNDGTDVVQPQGVALQQVVQAARRGDHDVDAGAQHVRLAIERHAAVDGSDANAPDVRDECE